jgi:plastocyanin
MRASRAPHAAACGAVALLVTGLLSGARSGAPRSPLVDIAAFQFAPARLSVTVGDTVVWSNADIVPHTATALEGGAWDSGTIATKGRWAYVVRQRGTVEYHCALHPSMRGTLEAK